MTSERQARPVEEDHGKRGPSGHAEVEQGDCLRGRNPFNRYFSLSLSSDTESNEYNGQLTYRSLNIYTGFPIYSKQCSTARLYKPFDKKISSFLWYGQWRVPRGNALSLVHGSSGGRIHIRCEPSVSLLAHTDALLLL